MDCSPPGSCVHEIFQAGILEWVAISFSRIFIGGVTLRKEVGGGNPTTRRHGANGACQSSSSPEAPNALGAVVILSLQMEPPGSGGCGLMQRGTGSPGPWGRAHWLVHPPQLHQPHDSPSLGTNPAQASGM